MDINIFNGPGDHTQHAYLNWRFFNRETDNLLDVMSDSYFEATSILVEEALRDNSDKKADGIIFPILFSFNHYIELRLKSIMTLFLKLEPDNVQIIKSFPRDKNGKIKAFSNNHQINELLMIVIKVTNKTKIASIERRGKRFKYSKSYMEQLKQYNIFNVSPQMDFSRYPMNSDSEIYFYANTFDNVTVSLINLKQIIRLINDELDGLFYQLSYLDDLMQEVKEMEKEYLNDYRDHY